MEFLRFSVILFCLGFAVGNPISKDAPRWCCKSDAELNKCRVFSNRANSVTNENLFPFNCVLGESTAGCIDKITNDEADIMALDGGDIYEHSDKLSIVAAEDNGVEDASYYAVAVVKANSVPGLNLHKISGYTTCHTGVGKTAGWNMPVGWFIRHGIDATTIRASCAPGGYDARYTAKLPDQCTDKWCALCKGDGQGNNVCERDNDESYYGYSGAFKCLKEVGNVAFVKHSTVPEEEHGSFQLLCPDATRAPMSDWKTCNLGRVPSHAIVMHASTSNDKKNDALNGLLNAMNNMNDFTSFGGDDLLWSSSVTDFLDRIGMDVIDYLGEDYYCNLQAIQLGQARGSCKVFSK